MGTLGKAIYTVGFWIRETGQAIDRLGRGLQGKYYFPEQRTYLQTLTPLYAYILFFGNLFIAFLFLKLVSVFCFVS